MKGEVTFQQQSVSRYLFEQMEPLFVKHYHEIAHYQDIAFDPDYESYMRAASLDMLRLYTAKIDNAIVGYAFFFVKNNLHYRKSLQAVQDIIYIDPEYRGFGHKFIDWCDKELKKDGVQVVYHHVKKAHDFGPLLERLGYKEIDHIYGKRLDLWQLPQP